MQHKKFNLNRAPFKGVVTEIAEEEGTNISTVWRGIHKYHNTRLLTILENKIDERLSLIGRIERKINNN